MSWRSRRRRAAMRKITAYCKEMLVRIQTEGIPDPTNSRGTRIMFSTGRYIDPATGKPMPRIGYTNDGNGWEQHIT